MTQVITTSNSNSFLYSIEQIISGISPHSIADCGKDPIFAICVLQSEQGHAVVVRYCRKGGNTHENILNAVRAIL